MILPSETVAISSGNALRGCRFSQSAVRHFELQNRCPRVLGLYVSPQFSHRRVFVSRASALVFNELLPLLSNDREERAHARLPDSRPMALRAVRSRAATKRCNAS